MGDVQYHGGYHDARGGYHDARGGYHEYRGGTEIMMFSIVGGYHPLKFEYHGDIMSTLGVFSTVGYSNNKRFSPHGTEHPPRYS